MENTVRKTNKYTVGDIVGNKTTEELYLGEAYVYSYCIQYRDYKDWAKNVYKSKELIVILKNPIKVYLYYNLHLSLHESPEDIRICDKKYIKYIKGNDISKAKLYLSKIENFMNMYDKLKVFNYEDIGNYGFSGFSVNASIRLRNDIPTEQILNDLRHVIDYKMKYNSISSYDVVIEDSKEALEYSSKYHIDYDTELRSYPEKFKLYDNYIIKGGSLINE